MKHSQPQSGYGTCMFGPDSNPDMDVSGLNIEGAEKAKLAVISQEKQAMGRLGEGAGEWLDCTVHDMKCSQGNGMKVLR